MGKYSFFANDTECKSCSSGLSCTYNGLEVNFIFGKGEFQNYN